MCACVRARSEQASKTKPQVSQRRATGGHRRQDKRTKVPVLLSPWQISIYFLRRAVVVFPFTLYRRVKDPFDGHFCRNTDCCLDLCAGVILLFVLRVFAAARSSLTGNPKPSLEKAETFTFLHMEPSIVFSFSLFLLSLPPL